MSQLALVRPLLQIKEKEKEKKNNICHDLAKRLSHYLYFFSFLFFSFSWTYYTEGSAGKCHVT